MITIYRYNSTDVRAVVNPDDKSEQRCGLMRDDIVTLSFTSPVYIAFQPGDYTTVFNKLYKLNKPAVWTKSAKRRFEYVLTLEGLQYDLGKAQYFTLNANNRFTEGKFSLRGTALDFCNLIIVNLKRWAPDSDWRLGSVVETPYETLEFNGNSCMEVLSQLADKFKTEWIIEGTKISLYQKQVNSGLVLEYGQGKALSSIGQQSQDETANIITRLFVFGSSKNLGKNYRNGAPRLRLASGLYIEKNTEKYGIIEKTIVFDGTGDFEEIYPHRTGILSAVTAPDTFTDDAIDFDVNDYLMGTDNGTQILTAKVTFNTGMLAGVTFEVHSFNYATKTFVINPNTESQTIAMPSADFKPAPGDEYVITDIVMPESYYIKAEAYLLQKATEYLNKAAVENLQYPMRCNDSYFKMNGIRLIIGSVYSILLPEAGLTINKRVISYVRNLRNPDKYEFELADTVPAQPLIIKLINKL